MVSPQHLLKEACRCGDVAFSREDELNSGSFFIDGAVEMLPLLADLHLYLIYSERGAAHLQVRTDSLVDLWHAPLNPPEHSSMVHREAALTHHLFKGAVA